jgi:hypothetical protein
MGSVAYIEALYNAREESVARATKALSDLEDSIMALSSSLEGAALKRILALSEKVETSDPLAVRRALQKVTASADWKKPEAIAAKAYALALDGMKRIEAETYRFETESCAKAMNDFTAEGCTVKPVLLPEEEALAQSAIDWGLPQEDRLAMVRDELAMQLRSKIGLAVLSWGGDFIATSRDLAAAYEVSFKDFCKAVREIGFAGVTWAMRVARRSASKSWQSQ